MKPARIIPNSLSERIDLRLKKLGKTERGASLEAGLSDSFLRNIRRSKSSSPRIDTLDKVAHVLATNVSWLVTGEGNEQDCSAAPAEQLSTSSFIDNNSDRSEQIEPKTTHTAPQERQSLTSFGFTSNLEENTVRPPENPNAIVGEKFALSNRRLPVYGQAVGGIDGEFPMNGSTLYNVLCPPQLSEVSGAYAVAISGDSMYPRYEDGEIAFVDPTRSVRRGDYVIAQILSEAGEAPYAYVKKFIRHNAGGLILEQFNPAKELYFPHERVVSVHYIALAGTAPSG